MRMPALALSVFFTQEWNPEDPPSTVTRQQYRSMLRYLQSREDAIFPPRADSTVPLYELHAAVGRAIGMSEATHSVQLHPVLEQFPVLKNDPRVADFDGDDLRDIERRVQQNPDGDEDACKELAKYQEDLFKTYQEVIQERVAEKGRTKVWAEVIKRGNDDFREVYEVVWNNTIVKTEEEGIDRYRIAVAKLQPAEDVRRTRQQHTGLLAIYREAARAKPAYDNTMNILAERFRAGGPRIRLSICPTLKKASRIIEKSVLKSTVAGDVSRVKDIVRSMAVVESMEHVAIILELLWQMQAEGRVTVIRIKERFLQEPSGGGWRDVMINLRVAGHVHICELQVAHRMMLTARKGMPGHAVYNVVRNVMEMLAYTRGAVDMAGLVDFVEWDDDEGMRPIPERLANWFEDDAPMSDWAGVTTNAQGWVTALDVHVVDPGLSVPNPRLPHLERMALCYVDGDAKTKGIELNLSYMRALSKAHPTISIAAANGGLIFTPTTCKLEGVWATFLAFDATKIPILDLSG